MPSPLFPSFRAIGALASLALVASASAQLYSNAAPITIPNTGAANPFPSVIHVANAPTSIDQVNVTLRGLSHTYCSDVKVLLVGPTGASVKLFEVPQDSRDFTNNTITFSSDTSNTFFFPPTSGVYAPTGGTYVIPGAPGNPGASSFASMLGTNANGNWSLYVYDNVAGDGGTIAQGWSIEFFETDHPIAGFTYQGHIEGANPGDPVALRFRAYDAIQSSAPTDTLAGPVTVATTVASDGTVTVPVNFGIELPTDRQSYVQIDVSLGGGPFFALSPRQPISPAPLAMTAIHAAHASAADYATNAESANTAANAANASNANLATLATNAGDSDMLGSVAAASYARRDAANTFSADQVIATANALAFGTIGNGTGTAEGSDLIAFRRFNTANNQSELRLTIGDDPSANADAFSIGYTTTGTNYVEVFRLQSNGTAIKPGGGAWSAPSDARLKHDIQPLTGSLDKLMGLRGVSFQYNDPKRAGACAGTMTGFIAQDVEPIFPRWVSTGEDGYKLLTITGFEALTVEALRDLRAEKDAQIAEKDAQIAELREQVAEMQRRLDRIEAQMK